MINVWPWPHFKVKHGTFQNVNVIQLKKSPTKSQNFSLTLSEHVKGTLFYIISRRHFSSKFKGIEKLWKCEIFPCQNSLKWTLLTIQFAVLWNRHNTLQWAVSCPCLCHVCFIGAGHAGGRVHCSCGFWSEIHMITNNQLHWSLKVMQLGSSVSGRNIFMISHFHELNWEVSSAYYVEKKCPFTCREIVSEKLCVFVGDFFNCITFWKVPLFYLKMGSRP
jgi:hypothetical protein